MTDVLKYIETQTGKIFYALQDAQSKSWKICQVTEGPDSFRVLGSVSTREEAQRLLEGMGLEEYREGE